MVVGGRFRVANLDTGPEGKRTTCILLAVRAAISLVRAIQKLVGNHQGEGV